MPTPLIRSLSTSFTPRKLALVLALALSSHAQAQKLGDNQFPDGQFDDCEETYNPWAGVDDSGNIHGIPGSQNAVGDDGKVYKAPFAPSCAVGDLNGDGKPDLVMTDPRGFFWYYPNSGTPQKPKFTQGIMMPLWVGEDRIEWMGEAADDLVPRVQLVDTSGSRKLDIVCGNYTGKLFLIPNIGSATRPNFRVMNDIAPFEIPTRRDNSLWCNYLSPFLFNWSGRPGGLLDLIMGEGTYSANSIYLFQNMGTSDRPVYNKDHEQKIIPGMGMEQLTPTVYDWNNDGKPDIITGDRTGGITVYLNTSTDEMHPTFAPGKPLTIGGQTNFGSFTTVIVADLTGNKLPNLIIGSDQGTLLYATNKGKIGAPSFPDAPVPLTGVNPYPKIMVPTKMDRLSPHGVPNELVVCTNPSIEKTLKFPPALKKQYALKFYRFPIANPLFPEQHYPPVEDVFHEHVYRFADGMTLKYNTRYRFHVWIKADSGISNMRYHVLNGHRFKGQIIVSTADIPIDTSPDWTEYTTDFSVTAPDPKGDPVGFITDLRWVGYGTFYMADTTVEEEL